jgi:putative SOS response-associated peptidase YedK
VFTKPAFKDAIVRRRCLVPADGFIEWRKEGKARRPFHIRTTGGGLFAMAGIWSRWKSPAGDRVETFSILTTDANDVVKPLHDRMPVIVPPDKWDLWLGAENDRAVLEALLVPFPADAIETVEVNRAVNDVKNEDPSVLEPANDDASD